MSVRSYILLPLIYMQRSIAVEVINKKLCTHTKSARKFELKIHQSRKWGWGGKSWRSYFSWRLYLQNKLETWCHGGIIGKGRTWTKRQLVSPHHSLPAGWYENEQPTSLLSWGGLEVRLEKPLIHIVFMKASVSGIHLPPFNIWNPSARLNILL